MRLSTTILLLSTIALSLIPQKAEAQRRLIRQQFTTSNPQPTFVFPIKATVPRNFQTPSVKPVAGVEPTCYVKMKGGPVQFLDHLCGVNDPQPDRRRSPYELDKDGVPFVMRENYQTIQNLQRQMEAAQRRFEDEKPLSATAKQLMAEQKALYSQYASAKIDADRTALINRLEANQKKIAQDPSVLKSYEMMRKLYQRN